MKNRKLATHGMTYGELAAEASTIVGGVFITVSILLTILFSAIGASVTGWIVVGIPLLVSFATVLPIWRLGFGALDVGTIEAVVPSVIVVGTIASLFTPMILGVMLVPAGGVALLWAVFGLLWLVTALAAVVEAVRDWLVTGPTSVPLDIVAIATTISAVACTGLVFLLGMTGLLYGIVFLGGLLGVSIGLGFLAAEELVEPEKHLVPASEGRNARFGNVART